MLYVNFKGETLISKIIIKTYEFQDPNIAHEALKSKHIEMGSEIWIKKKVLRTGCFHILLTFIESVYRYDLGNTH